MQTQRAQIIVDNSPMNLFVARPDDDKRLPAIVVIQHQYGVDQFIEETTGRRGGAERATATSSTMDPHHPEKYVAESDRVSWPRGMEFLKKHLALCRSAVTLNS